MRVYVVRHAAAAPKGDYPSDADRPLTLDGKRQMSKVAAALARIGAAPAKVFTSPLVRARQTAEILAAALPDRPAVEECRQLATGHDPRNVVKFLSRQKLDEVAIVGHAPQLDEVVSLFLTGKTKPTVDVKKASVACIEFEKTAAAGQGILAWHLVPGVVSALVSEPAT